MTMAVERWTAQSRAGVGGAALVLGALALAPMLIGPGIVDRLTALFIYVILAAMWNALAGYCGLVSIGQQLFFGLGAYATIRIAFAGVDPFLAMILGAVAVGVLAWPVSLFMLRLKGGEFSIGMWVLASIGQLCVKLDPMIQGETGSSLISLNAYGADLRRNLIYWGALAAMTCLLAALFALLRSREGLAIQAIRDNEEAATSLGVRPERTKRRLFVLAAFGIALAGALWLAQAVSFQPKSYFSVQWTAYMIFMVLVGGIGRFEGAILGAVLFFAVETFFAATGVWYLIGLGATAIVFSLYFPRGLWGAVAARTGVQLLPLGYRATNTET
ncbi:branched-chain amino acid ABC transporter permease [bacterium]|nr:branched-chain amino acid ABC transporter permease [bacterium]